MKIITLSHCDFSIIVVDKKIVFIFINNLCVFNSLDHVLSGYEQILLLIWYVCYGNNNYNKDSMNKVWRKCVEILGHYDNRQIY